MEKTSGWKNLGRTETRNQDHPLSGRTFYHQSSSESCETREIPLHAFMSCRGNCADYFFNRHPFFGNVPFPIGTIAKLCNVVILKFAVEILWFFKKNYL